jgi:hypothetical protein
MSIWTWPLLRSCYIFKNYRTEDITIYDCWVLQKVSQGKCIAMPKMTETVIIYTHTYTHFRFRYWENISPSNCWNTNTSCLDVLRGAQLCSKIHFGDSSCSTQLWKDTGTGYNVQTKVQYPWNTTKKIRNTRSIRTWNAIFISSEQRFSLLSPFGTTKWIFTFSSSDMLNTSLQYTHITG